MPDASEHLATDAQGDAVQPSNPLPAITADLFVAAGAAAVERVALEPAAGARLEELLRRVVGHCAALRR
jgi:hypothetical protein